MWRILRPMQMRRQPLLWIPGKSSPCAHHIAHGAVLLWCVGYSRHIRRSAHDHVQVAAMIGTAVRIQAQVGPVAEIAILPNGNTGMAACGGCGEGGAGEGFEIEKIPRVVGKDDVEVVGPDFVEAGFIVGGSCQVWLWVVISIGWIYFLSMIGVYKYS